MSEQCDAAITDAETRLAESKQRQVDLRLRFEELQRVATAMNADGITVEKVILGIDGELKALRALKANDGR